MARDAPTAPSWRPEFPDPADERVEFSDRDLETYVADGRPGITAQEWSVESPAVFWTDPQHIYVRLNWKQWVTVSTARPEQVAAICAARYCRITSSMDNVIKDDTAPVYRIAELPREIFLSAEEMADDDKKRAAAADTREYAESLDRVIESLKTVGMETQVFPNVLFGGDHAAAAISTASYAVLLDILPEGRDFTFCPSTGTDGHNPMNRWETDVVSMDFFDKLKRLRDSLKRTEEDAEVDVGLVANWNTLNNLRDADCIESIDGLHLFTYDALADDVKELFALHA